MFTQIKILGSGRRLTDLAARQTDAMIVNTPGSNDVNLFCSLFGSLNFFSRGPNLRAVALAYHIKNTSKVNYQELRKTSLDSNKNKGIETGFLKRHWETIKDLFIVEYSIFTRNFPNSSLDTCIISLKDLQHDSKVVVLISENGIPSAIIDADTFCLYLKESPIIENPITRKPIVFWVAPVASERI